MEFLKDIKEKTILVVPSNLKNKVLEYANSLSFLVQFKIYSLNEIKKYVLFDYDVDAVLYLMNKYGYKYEVAKNYIENLYYIEDKEYKEDKLRFLRDIKKELDSNNLLIYNDMFVKSYKNTPFIVFGYPYLDDFDKKILSNFKYEIIKNKEKNNKIDVYKFYDLKNELLFVVNKIIELVNKGVDINKIYLTNVNDDYNNEINRIFKQFNIPVDISNNSVLISTSIGKKVFEYLVESKSFSDTVEYMKTFDLTNQYNQNIYNSILSIFNKYNGLDYDMDTIISAVKNDLYTKSINNNNLDNMVRIGDINSFYNDDEYVFLLGFNLGVIPRIYKDEDYISEDLKPVVGLTSVNILNKLERESTLESIKSIKNIIISFKTHHLEDEFYPSNYVKEDCFNLIEDYESSTNYSKKYSKLYLGSMLDDLIKYDSKNKDLGKYYNSFKNDLDYMAYDNKFKGLKKDSLYKILDNKLVLSYTTMEAFYECQFKYYLNYILKLNKYEDSFDSFIGQLFHDVLSHVYNDDFDMDKCYDAFLKDREFNDKELFYIDSLKEELRIVCNRLKEFYNDTEIKKYFTEKKVYIDKDADIKVVFYGVVDKIMYQDFGDKTLVSVIDYKTGNAEIDIYNAVYGLKMQLLIYLYLIIKKKLFNNYSFVGFYLQRILDKEVNIDDKKSYLDLKNDSLKMYGYSNSDQDVLQKFDPTYADSKYIKSMKLKSDGNFYAYSKVLDEKTMNDLSNYVDKKVEEARDKILNCDFSINPKSFIGDREILGCEFCKYKDICFMKPDDIVKYKKNKNLDFLKEGDTNGE